MPVLQAISLPSVLAAVTYGQYADGLKAIPLLILMLLWGRFATWVDKDAPEILLPRQWINIGTFSGGVLMILCYFLIPNFIAAGGVAAMILLFVVAGYLGVRIHKAGLEDLKSVLREMVKSGRKRKDDDDEADYSEGVQFQTAKGAMVPPPDEESPDADAHEAAQGLLSSPLRKDAERLDLAPAGDEYKLKFLVDGIGYSGGSVEKNKSSNIITYLKKLSGMDLKEKRKPQTGMLKLTVSGARRECQIQTAGSSAGESLKVIVEPKKRHSRTLNQLGFPDDQYNEIRESVLSEKGIVLISAPKGQGLTSLAYALLRAHDAFLNHIQSVEREPDFDIEGVTQHKMPATSALGEESKAIQIAISHEPDILSIPALEESKGAQYLAEFASSGEKLIYVGLRAGSVFDTVTAWIKLVGDPKAALKSVRYVISGRLVRRLCPACKVAYKPDPAQLRKLNMDPKRVGELFQARTQPLTDPKGNPMRCEVCQDLRFKGRIGVYEVLIIDDDMRALFAAGANPNQFRATFRKQHGKYLQERAFDAVERGETSVQEVLRALKPGTEGAPAAPENSETPPPTSARGGAARPKPSPGKPPAKPPAPTRNA